MTTLSEKIDYIKNQYPHLSEQQISDALGRTKEQNIKNLFPDLSAANLKALIGEKKKPAADAAPKKELTEKQKAAIEKGKATKAVNKAAGKGPKPRSKKADKQTPAN